MIGRKTIRNFVCQWYMNHVMQWQKFLRKLSNANGFKKRFPALFCENFFMFVLFISNCTVFLIQFEINLHLCRSGSCNFSFLKNSQVQINSKLNSKSYDYLYKLNALQTKIVKLWVSRSWWCIDRGVLNLHHSYYTMVMTSLEKVVSSQPTVTWYKSTNQKIGIRTVYEIWIIKTSTL